MHYSYLKTILFFLALVPLTQVHAQCTNIFSWGSASAPGAGSSTTISTCTFQEEYNTLTAVPAGTDFISTYDLGGCITVHQGTPGGPVVAFGASPLNWTSTVAGTYYIHYNTDCFSCGTASSCGTATIQNVTGGGGGGPCGSIATIIGCGTSQMSSMSGPGSWNNFGCGFSTPGVESIWQFTATQSGIHSINVTGITGGNFIDIMWVNATAGCSEFAGWNCISDVLLTGNYGSMNWTAGETYYILFDPESTAASTITFNIDCPSGGPVTAGDCSVAVPICSDANFSIDPNGYGAVDELCTYCTANPGTNPSSINSGCLLSGELNSTWMQVNVALGGSLEFSFGTAGTNSNCYDWLMWPYSATACADIYADALSPVRCNWNTPCDGFTGVSSTVPAGGDPGNFEPTVFASSGDQFIICFSNYSSAVTNVPLVFSGTADISCTPLPVEMVDFVGENQGDLNLLTWYTGAEVNNSHFEIERSADGVEFKMIGQVDGVGTSTMLQSYAFSDTDFRDGMNYYRIKQVDLNGSSTYSKIIAINNDSNGGFAITKHFPNPTSENLNIELFSMRSEPVQLQIAQLSGQVDLQVLKEITAGDNSFVVPVQELSSGIYLLTFTGLESGQKDQVRFVVD